MTKWILATAVVLAQQAHSSELLNVTRSDGKVAPMMVYAPADKNICRGVAVVSHGLGGSEKGYEYLGEGLSGLGYMTVIVGHQESGAPAFAQKRREHGGFFKGLKALLLYPPAYQGRLMDIAAAKAWAQKGCASQRTVLLGHSMGGMTTMMEAGARNSVAIQGGDSFDAYVALSTQGAVGETFPAHAWSDIKKPVLLITGTLDFDVGDRSWQSRTDAFYDMPAGCKWSAVIDGASHMNLAGVGFAKNTKKLVMSTVGAFLNELENKRCNAPPKLDGMTLDTK